MIGYRKDIDSLRAYMPHENPAGIKLDANENCYGIPEIIQKLILQETSTMLSELHRYPDTTSLALRESIGEAYGVQSSEVIVGVGSDQLIQIIMKTLCNPEDSILVPSPSFSMYGITGKVEWAKVVEVPLDQDFQYDIELYLAAIQTYEPKMIFLCSPNNPTGGIIEEKDIRLLLESYSGLVIIDEAYGEFTGESYASLIKEYHNLIVLGTFSKLYGLAGVRVGFGFAHKTILDQIHKVRPPYNLSLFAQRCGEIVMRNIIAYKEQQQAIIKNREDLIHKLSNFKSLVVYPSYGNFILVRAKEGPKLFRELLEKGILVRNLHDNGVLSNSLRITVGTEEENEILIDAIGQILGGM